MLWLPPPPLALPTSSSQHSPMNHRVDLADTLRQRLLRGLHAGTLSPGDRLPSARELAPEFETDHRVVLAAYRELAQEGLVELRQRGGIYVAATRHDGQPTPGESWMVRLLAEGVARDIPISEFHDWFRRAVETLRLRAAVVQGTADQLAGICRELHDDYGLEATGVDADALAAALASALTNAGDLPREVRQADILVTTEGFERLTRAVATLAGKPVVVAAVRPDLIGGEWRLLLRQPVYVVVADARFRALLERFFANTPGAHHLRILVAGEDELSGIPDGAPVYVTRGARAVLGDALLHGRMLPTARVFSDASAHELIGFIVRANLAAIAALPR